MQGFIISQDSSQRPDNQPHEHNQHMIHSNLGHYIFQGPGFRSNMVNLGSAHSVQCPGEVRNILDRLGYIGLRNIYHLKQEGHGVKKDEADRLKCCHHRSYPEA